MHDQQFPTDEIAGKIYDWQLIRRLLHYIVPYRLLLATTLIFLLAGAGLELVGPYLVKIAIDTYIKAGDFTGLSRICVIFLLALVLRSLLSFLESYATQLLGQRVIRDLRMELFNHVQSLSLSFFDRYPVGRIMTRIGSDVEVINEMLSDGILMVLGNVLTLLGILLVMLWMNVRLTLVIFSILPLVVAASLKFRTGVRQAFRDTREKIARINSFLQENITGMKEVQLFGREKQNFGHFDRINREHQDAYLRAVFYYALFFPFIEILASVSTALIIWYGGVRAFEGTLTIGLLVAFIEYMGRFFRPVRELSEKYNVLQATMSSAERIFGLLDTRQQVRVSVSPRPFPGLQKEIIFDRVWFAYEGENYILKDISFCLPRGKTLAIVGATGAGKTSIVNLLGRYYDFQQGRILIDGVDIREYDLKELRSAIAMVQQDAFLFSTTILHNITLGNPAVSLKRVQQVAEYINASTFIEQLPEGYQQVLTERGNTLSAGQKQLLAFARALAGGPDILVLDEATASIDSETESLIQDALRKLVRNRTSIIIAHRLSTITDADQILVLHKGRVAEEGTHSTLLLKGGIYKKLYETLVWKP
ncbi:MAG: ABC transporter ATP-binding protein [bacterium]